MPTLKSDFLKKPRFSSRKTLILRVQGVEVESKNRSKIDVKNDAETEGLGNSIFIDFWWIWEPSWPSKTEPRRSKIDVEKASKFDHFLKASWNAIFSAKRRQKTIRGAPMCAAWRRAELAWGGLWRGKTDVQAPGRVAVRNVVQGRTWKDLDPTI